MNQCTDCIDFGKDLSREMALVSYAVSREIHERASPLTGVLLFISPNVFST